MTVEFDYLFFQSGCYFQPSLVDTPVGIKLRSFGKLNLDLRTDGIQGLKLTLMVTLSSNLEIILPQVTYNVCTYNS